MYIMMYQATLQELGYSEKAYDTDKQRSEASFGEETVFERASARPFLTPN
jgi:hypothetical protein